MTTALRRSAAVVGSVLLCLVLGCGGVGGGGGGTSSLLGRWRYTQSTLTNGNVVTVPGTFPFFGTDVTLGNQVRQFSADGTFYWEQSTPGEALLGSAGHWTLDGNRLALTLERDGEDANGNGAIDSAEWSSVPQPDTAKATVTFEGADRVRLAWTEAQSLVFGIAEDVMVRLSKEG